MTTSDIKEGVQFTITEGSKGIFWFWKVNSQNAYLASENWEGTIPYRLQEVVNCFFTGKWKLYTAPFPLSKLFSTQEHNVMQTALEQCAADFQEENKGGLDDLHDSPIYAYLHEMPSTSFVTEMTDKIYALGFKIVPA